MGNSFCSAFCSSENETEIDLGFLVEMVQDVSYLDSLFSNIDQRLQAITTRNERVLQNTYSRQVGSSSKFDSCTNFGKDLVMKMLKRAERNRSRMWLKSDYNRQTREGVIEVLKGASQIQLFAAGVCMVGYFLEIIELFQDREQCVQLLRRLCVLARGVKQLDQCVPFEKEMLDKVVNCILDGSVLCLRYIESPRLPWLFQASVDAGDMQKLVSQMENAYADLTLAILIRTLDYLTLTPVGREFAIKRVTRLLKLDPADDSKRAVVIYGFGGIGKTTLASVVFRTVDLKGYRFCRLDMDQNISNDGIKQLQEQILRELFDQGDIMLNSYKEGQKLLTDAFTECDHRIFIFIDNALEANSLAKLLPIDLSCLPNGMRILVTTRKLDQTDMLSRIDFERIPYEVDVLSSSDSKNLLIRIALGSANASLPPGINGTDVDEIVNMCGGIPLLVELVGSKFKKYLSTASGFKSLKEFLKEFVAAGRDIERVVDEVYESLDELSKEAFLDIMWFFDNRSIQEVSAVVGTHQIEVLLDAALVKLSKVDEPRSLVWETTQIYFEKMLKVDNNLKERGRMLPLQDRILSLESLKDALQDNQKLQKIKGIAISTSEISDEFEIEAESLDYMHSSLRILSLPKSIKVHGTCRHSFESLKYLEVDGKLPMLPKQLKRLAVLIVTDSDSVKELRYSADPPTEINCIPTSIGQLESLINLNLSGCSNLTTLPDDIGCLSTLQVLNLSHCTKLISLPLTLGQLKSLSILIMKKCSALIILPESLGNLSALKFLDLSGCSNLQSLTESFGQLTSLKILDMSNCVQLASLPRTFEELKSLEFLSIDGCKNLKTLHSDFGALSSLKNLWAMGIKLRKMDASRSLIQPGKQIGQRYPPSILADSEPEEFLHTVKHILFHGGSRFVRMEGDGGQLVDWSWSFFAGEIEEVEVEVEVSVLLTMCDLSLDCNNNALRIVRKEIQRRMEESRGGRRNFQIVYAEAGDSLEESQSEEHIRQTLLKLNLPTRTCACMPIDNRTSQRFAFALYSLLTPESRDAIQSLNTCIFTLRVRIQGDRKWIEFQNECFPTDYLEEYEWKALGDQEGGFDRLFSTLDSSISDDS